MPDEVTSTDRRQLYVVRFSPGGEKYLVTAGNAIGAQNKGIGLATLNDVRYTGIDSYPASEDDLDDPTIVGVTGKEEEE